MRFAIEEGSWITFLRIQYYDYIKDHMTRLITLEDIIWNSGKANLDDYAYYLYELVHISDLYVKTLIKFWKENHDYAKNDDIIPRFVGAILNTFPKRGQDLFNGAKRLLKSKLTQLEKVLELSSDSQIHESAKINFNKLNSELNKETLSIDTNSTLMTLILLQKELSKNIHGTSNREHDEIDPEEFIDQIGWNRFNFADLNDISKFKEFVILSLYDRPEEDTFEAAIGVLSVVLKGGNYNQKVTKRVLDKFNNTIHNIISSQGDNIDYEITQIKAIETELPLLLIKLKLGQIEVDTSKEGINKEIDYLWDVFVDNINRVKRFETNEEKLINIQKLVKSIYFKLIDHRMTPVEIINIIIMQINTKLQNKSEYDSTWIETKNQEIKNMGNGSNKNKLIDIFIIEEISFYILNTM
ncbi:MAG: hypothetical protein OEY49_06290 [Candidatus Heimdallarchaeota archaeon]|nr:hypothetical protein [Candidatus Heimdallarchaeota archaeon]